MSFEIYSSTHQAFLDKLAVPKLSYAEWFERGYAMPYAGVREWGDAFGSTGGVGYASIPFIRAIG